MGPRARVLDRRLVPHESHRYVPPYRWTRLVTRTPQWTLIDEATGEGLHVHEEAYAGRPITFRVTGGDYESTQHETLEGARAAMLARLEAQSSS